MEGFDLKNFIDTFNFDQLMQFFDSGEWKHLLENKILLAAGGLILAAIAYPKSRGLGMKILVWTLVAVVYGVGGIVLKNSVISQIGPFLLGLTLALGAVGYVVWMNLLTNR